MQESSQAFKREYDKLQEDIYRQVKEKDRKIDCFSNTIRDLQSQIHSFH